MFILFSWKHCPKQIKTKLKLRKCIQSLVNLLTNTYIHELAHTTEQSFRSETLKWTKRNSYDKNVYMHMEKANFRCGWSIRFYDQFVFLIAVKRHWIVAAHMYFTMSFFFFACHTLFLLSLSPIFLRSIPHFPFASPLHIHKL